MNRGHDRNRNSTNDSCDGKRTRLLWFSNTVHVFKALLQAMKSTCQSDIKEQCSYTVGRYKVTESKFSVPIMNNMWTI